MNPIVVMWYLPRRAQTIVGFIASKQAVWAHGGQLQREFELIAGDVIETDSDLGYPNDRGALDGVL
jgi:hypothetical protein